MLLLRLLSNIRFKENEKLLVEEEGVGVGDRVDKYGLVGVLIGVKDGR